MSAILDLIFPKVMKYMYLLLLLTFLSFCLLQQKCFGDISHFENIEFQEIYQLCMHFPWRSWMTVECRYSGGKAVFVRTVHGCVVKRTPRGRTSELDEQVSYAEVTTLWILVSSASWLDRWSMCPPECFPRDTSPRRYSSRKNRIGKQGRKTLYSIDDCSDKSQQTVSNWVSNQEGSCPKHWGVGDKKVQLNRKTLYRQTPLMPSFCHAHRRICNVVKCEGNAMPTSLESSYVSTPLHSRIRYFWVRYLILLMVQGHNLDIGYCCVLL